MTFTYQYPRPAVSADVVVVDQNRSEILLIQRANEPFAGMWALPGGFMEIYEDAESAAKRELKEETGLVASTVTQIAAYSSVDRDPRGRVVTIAFIAEISNDEHYQASDDAADAKWFSLNDLPELAFDHNLIIDDARSRFI